MFDGTQDAIQAVAPLAQRRPLPGEGHGERFCATASWVVQQRGDLAQRKSEKPQGENPLQAAEILVAVEPIASFRPMRGREQLEPVVVMQCPLLQPCHDFLQHLLGGPRAALDNVASGSSTTLSRSVKLGFLRIDIEDAGQHFALSCDSISAFTADVRSVGS